MSRKININRPFIKREDITQRKNFERLLIDYKKSAPAPRINSKLYMFLAAAVVVIVGVTYYFNSNKTTTIATAPTTATATFIHPPVKKLDVAYKNFQVESNKPTEIMYNNKTRIKIPASAFVFEDGSLVAGKVEIKYREMHDAVDFFLSGIPMTYDSGGVQYTFESAGMCEILASQYGKKVFLNKNKQVEISMASNQTGTNYNLYYLDSAKKNWVYLGKDVVSENNSDTIKTTGVQSIISKDSTPYDPITVMKYKELALAKKEIEKIEKQKPAEPKKAGNNRAQFTIDVDPIEFPEIAIYKKMIFEVGDENKNFDSKVYNITYEDVSLKENKRGESYKMTLKKGAQSWTYIVYPVFEGKSYDEAVREYNQKTKEYETKLAQRKDDEKRAMEKYEEQVKKMEADRQLQYEKMEREYAEQQARYQKQASSESLVYRTFTINKFGTYNCDQPGQLPQGIVVAATFVDEQGNTLNLNNVYHIEKGRNAIFTYYGSYFDKLKFNNNVPNMLWAITQDNKLAYLKYDDFSQLNFTTGTNIIKMHLHEMTFQNDNEVKSFLNI